MRYEEFRDVMIAKGYSIVDVLDCIRDFLSSSAADSIPMLSFNTLVGTLKGYSALEALKQSYDVDDAFTYLINQHFDYDFRKPFDVDTPFENLCNELWSNCACSMRRYDDYWQNLLKDC